MDGFQSLEVVLPSGEIVTASKTSYPDLFFAMRGGGGNAYGVVTSYTVTARKVGKFHSGLLVYALNETNRVLEAVHDFTRYNTNPKANLIVSRTRRDSSEPLLTSSFIPPRPRPPGRRSLSPI